MNRVLAALSFVFIVALPAAAIAQVERARVVDAVNQARQSVAADPATVPRAISELQRLLEKTADEQYLERFILHGTIALIARDSERYDLSVSAFSSAAEAIKQVPGQTDRYAGQIEAAAHALGKSGRFDEAFSAFDQAINIRQQNGLLSTDYALYGATQHLWLALRVAREDRIVTALNQISAATLGYAGTSPQPLIPAYVAMTGALAQAGLYGQMTEMADLTAATMDTVRLETEFGGGDVNIKSRACNDISANASLLSEILTSAGDFWRAGNQVHHHSFDEFCDDVLNDDVRLTAKLAQARLSLASGNALAAERRLLEAGKIGLERLEAADNALAISLLTATRTQLGFLGQAAIDQARISSLEELVYPNRQIDWMISLAYHHFLSGDDAASLDMLAEAEKHTAGTRPNDWYTRGRIAFIRAYILIDRDDPDKAKAIVADFRNLRAAILKQAGPDGKPAVLGTKVAESVERMEVLFDLLSSAAAPDKPAVETALQRLREIGAPTLPETTYFGQIAQLNACIVSKDLGICGYDVLSAFDLPLNVPYMRTDYVAGQDAYNLSGDRFRYGPLRKKLYRRLSSLFWRASIGARKEARADLPGNKDWEQLAARFAGADIAFELAQQLTEGAANTAAIQVNARLAAGSGPLADLLRQRQELSAVVLRKSQAVLEDGGREDIDADMARLEDINKRIADDHPDYVARYRLRSLGYHKLKPLLRDDEAIVLINSLGDTTDVFVVTTETLIWRRPEINTSELTAKVAQLRAGLDPTGGARGASPLAARYGSDAFDRGTAHELYKLLFDEVDPIIGGKTLLVSANGPLSTVPLSILVTERPSGKDSSLERIRETSWLIRKHPMLVLPTVASLSAREFQPDVTVATTGFTGFGDPDFGGGSEAGVLSELAPLPGTREEISQLADLFEPGARQVFLGGDASETALRSANLQNRRVLAFATHGLMAGEIGNDSEPGLALSMPKGDGPFPPENDGFLTASEASSLKINAEWLLLSACNTAAAGENPDSGGYSGLAQAFLFAGAKSILVSHWPVSDAAAPHLTVNMIGWHERNRHLSKAAALQKAMLDMIDNQAEPALAHPSNWAPFVLFGTGG
ncbi:MAG: CHAT domain-containing protein [Rhizobiaceae bacterium]